VQKLLNMQEMTHLLFIIQKVRTLLGLLFNKYLISCILSSFCTSTSSDFCTTLKVEYYSIKAGLLNNKQSPETDWPLFTDFKTLFCDFLLFCPRQTLNNRILIIALMVTSSSSRAIVNHWGAKWYNNPFAECILLSGVEGGFDSSEKKVIHVNRFCVVMMMKVIIILMMMVMIVVVMTVVMMMMMIMNNDDDDDDQWWWWWWLWLFAWKNYDSLSYHDGQMVTKTNM